jgi:hypothetical protein
MNHVDRHATDRSPDSGCRHLAFRVIHQAFRDLSGSVGSRADQESARAFLAGSWMLYRWCEIANVNAEWTIARALKLADALRPKTSRPEGGRHHVELGFSTLARRQHLVRGARRRDRD